MDGYKYITLATIIKGHSNYERQSNISNRRRLSYTVKSITFNSIDLIKPVSVIAMCIEIFSYFLIGIFVFVLAVSLLFSSKMDHLNENIKRATYLCVRQNQTIVEYVKEKYQTDIQTAIIEFGNIKKSLEILKKIIDRIF